ncbi:hypothetical protein QOT17_002524 [Balamuthia mandrillaris]
MKLYQQDLPVPSLKQFSIRTPDPTLVFRHQYPIPYHLMLIINLQAVKWLHTGVIVLTPPDSPWNSPLTIVPKKDADGNPVVITSKVQGFFIASALDLIWSYIQCSIAPENCIKNYIHMEQ